MDIGTDIDHAAAILRAGGLVAIPTETVYGLAADARNPAAVAKIFAAKQRPTSHPLIVHVASAAQAATWTADFHATAATLAAACWPGPLTMILPRHPDVNLTVTGGANTIGLRVPNHPMTLALLQAVDTGLAAPSANRFGSVSPTTAAAVAAELGSRVDYILDGGRCEVGVESTIVDVCDPTAIALLRPGGITRDTLLGLVGPLHAVSAHSPVVSGSLPSHYAPNATVIVVEQHRLADVLNATAASQPSLTLATLAPRHWLPANLPPSVLVFDVPADPAGMAHALYQGLRDLDAQGAKLIVAALPSAAGLGEAVIDRLARAAGPRPT